MWLKKFTTIIGVVCCVIGSGTNAFITKRNDTELCSTCSCFGSRIVCKHLKSSEVLLNYHGPEAKFLSIEGSKLDLEQRYLSRFQNTSSVIIFSNDLGNNFSIGSLNKVINLNLYNNSLKSIDDNFLFHNTKLANLNLEHNDLSFIAERAFGIQQRLLRLRLSHNSLSQLLPDIFVGLTSLKELDLSVNRIQRFEERTFTPLVALKYLNISGNLLENLSNSVLGNLSTLQILDASDNRIQHIDSDTFASLKSLKVLSLRNNLLEEVEEGTWSGLSALEELDLGGNKLQRVAAHAFSPLATLRVLILRDNLLEEVEEGAWSGLEASLEELDLSGNRLLRAEAALAAAQAPLRVLRLGRNNITSFGPALVEALVQRPALSALLQPNPLRCACGELRDAWVEADAQGLLKDLVCASGRPWGAAMRNLKCGDESDVEDQDADDPMLADAGEEAEPDTTVAAIVTEESPHLQTNSPKNENITNTSFPVGAVVVTLPANNSDDNSTTPHIDAGEKVKPVVTTPAALVKKTSQDSQSSFPNSGDNASIILPAGIVVVTLPPNESKSNSGMLPEVNFTFLPQSSKIDDALINDVSTKENVIMPIDMEFALVFLVCVAAVGFSIAFAVVLILYLKKQKIDYIQLPNQSSSSSSSIQRPPLAVEPFGGALTSRGERSSDVPLH